MAAYVPNVSSSHSSHALHRPRRAHSHKPRPLSPNPLPLHLQDPHRPRIRRQDHTSYPAHHHHHPLRYEGNGHLPCCSPCHSTVSHFVYPPSPIAPSSPWYHAPMTPPSHNHDRCNHMHSRSYAHSIDFLDTPPLSAGAVHCGRGHQRSFDFLESPLLSAGGAHSRRGQQKPFDFSDSSCFPNHCGIRPPSRRVSSHRSSAHERRGASVIVGGDWYDHRSHDSMSTLSTISSRAPQHHHHSYHSSVGNERLTPSVGIRHLPVCRRPYYTKSEWVSG